MFDLLWYAVRPVVVLSSIVHDPSFSTVSLLSCLANQDEGEDLAQTFSLFLFEWSDIAFPPPQPQPAG